MIPRDHKEKRRLPYSVSLNLADVSCLVVGGGTVALRKIESLLSSGAKVTVVSPRIIPEIENLEGIGRIQREFHPLDLEGKFLVISATNVRAVNEEVAIAARRRSMLVNVVDVPELCNFYVNSQVCRGELTISVSTGGASPALSKRIRGELERQYGPEYEGFLILMREYRPLIIRRIPDPVRRKEAFERLANSGIEKVYREKGEAAAKKAIDEIIMKIAHIHGKTESES
jgi:precorrin-2 dehydrogenase/sirohydrochlorin ferrochelatase